ncbi:MAG: hypothetical protein KUG67_03400, partial [Proteobacteria bacterium]|nr:hypothetical protein [Pseudomonadota bacterium]
MTTTLRKTILQFLLLSLVAQGLSAQVFASVAFASVIVPCHSVESAQASDKNLQHYPTNKNNQQTEHSQSQPDCCMTGCDMGSCFSALLPADYPLSSSLFPAMETAYLALLTDSQ